MQNVDGIAVNDPYDFLSAAYQQTPKHQSFYKERGGGLYRRSA
jgi:hypothetical protein